MNRAQREFMRACEGLRLTPSRWIPHIRVPEGIYQAAHEYHRDEGEDFGKKVGKPVYVPFFSVYELAWTWALKGRGVTTKGFWISLWSFLHDVDMGVYDYRTWIDDAEEE